MADTKVISLANFKKLEKMMALTISDNDPESLAAIRQANKILKSHKLTWADIFGRLVTVDVEEAPAPSSGDRRAEERGAGQPSAATQGDAIDRAFDEVEPTLRPGSFADMIADFKTKWKKDHWLSPRQRQVLFDAAQRARTMPR